MRKNTKLLLLKKAAPVFIFLYLSAGAIIEAGEVRVLVSSGFFNFRQAEFREIYGGLQFFGFGAELYTGNHFGLAAGISLVKGRGEALTIEGDPVLFPVKFSRWSFPLLLKYREIIGPLQLAIGAGLAYSVYKESWVEVDLSSSGKRLHLRGELNLDFRLTGRLFLRAGANWESIPTGVSSLLSDGEKVSLAGFSLLAGLGFKF
ncbi:MAG: hypothetical protein WBI18_00810 [Candidatus Saccharicenans sp.]